MRYQKHVFVCANQKPEGKKCCGAEHGTALVDAFKAALTEKGLNLEIRAQKSGCLDLCGKGPTMVVYPEGVFYGNVQLSDVQEIVDKHLVENEVVERLVIA